MGAPQCGDRCEALCTRTGARLAECRPDSLTWQDLGATSRSNFVEVCRQQWERERLDLSASDLAVALDFCRDTQDALADLSCEELVALYAPTP